MFYVVCGYTITTMFRDDTTILILVVVNFVPESTKSGFDLRKVKQVAFYYRVCIPCLKFSYDTLFLRYQFDDTQKRTAKPSDLKTRIHVKWVILSVVVKTSCNKTKTKTKTSSFKTKTKTKISSAKTKTESKTSSLETKTDMKTSKRDTKQVRIEYRNRNSSIRYMPHWQSSNFSILKEMKFTLQSLLLT